MKKIFSLILIFACLQGLSQFTVLQPLGSKATLQKELGGIKADSAMIVPVFPDTASANIGAAPKFYPGNLIRVGDYLYMRNQYATAWVLVSGSLGGLPDGDKGDITVSGAGTTWLIDNDVVTYGKMQNVSAINRIIGRMYSSGNPEELTGTDVTSILDVFTSTTKGLAPASGGGTTNFLRADGTWAAPPGGSGTDNANVGSGYRLVIPSTQEIKTLFPGYGVLMDSTTNSDGITITVDTSGVATLYDVNNVPTLYTSNGTILSDRAVDANFKFLHFTKIKDGQFKAGTGNNYMDDVFDSTYRAMGVYYNLTDFYTLEFNKASKYIEIRSRTGSNEAGVLFQDDSVKLNSTSGSFNVTAFRTALDTNEYKPVVWGKNNKSLRMFNSWGELGLGGGSVSANNVLTVNGSNQVQLGGSAVQYTDATWGAFSFTNTFNSLDSSGFIITSSSTAAANNRFRLLDVSTTGTNANSDQTTFAGRFENQKGGTGAISIGIGGFGASYGVYGEGQMGVYGVSTGGKGVYGVTTATTNQQGVYGYASNASADFSVSALYGSSEGGASALFAHGGSGYSIFGEVFGSGIGNSGIGIVMESRANYSGWMRRFISSPGTKSEAVNNFKFNATTINQDVNDVAAGFGGIIDFELRTTVQDRTSNSIIYRWTDATDASYASELVFKAATSATLGEKFVISGNGAIYVTEVAAPGTPASGYFAVYAKTDGKIYGKNDGGTEYDLTAGGGGGITSLNTLTGATQTFATGTSGTNFNISSSGTAHTFNIPDAGLSARGLVTTSDQSFSGLKTFSGGLESSFIEFHVSTPGSSNYAQITGDISYLAGSTNDTRVKTYQSVPTTTLTANNNFGMISLIPFANISEAGSGTHNLISNIIIGRLNIIDGSATANYGASLYILGSATGTAPTNNYSMWIDSGTVRMDGVIQLEEQAAPGTPSSGFGYLYVKTDGKIYFKNDGGTEYDLTATGGGGGALNDLTDVVITAAATGEYLRYDGANWVDATIQAGDVPTLNQNTTGSAATLTTTRTIWGQNFNGSANVSGNLTIGTANLLDANGNEFIIFSTTASAVNEWTLANGATGVNPKLTASGEANVGLDFQVKGTGVYNWLATASGSTDMRWYEDTDNGTNYISIIGQATLGGNQILTLPNATGTFITSGNLTDITATGTITSGTWNGTDVAFANIAQLAGLSVLGRSANSTGDMAAITGTDGQVLRVSGTTLGFGTIDATAIGSGNIATARMTNLKLSKTFAIAAPTASENVGWFTNEAITITNVTGVMLGTSQSVTLAVNYGDSRATADGTIVASNTFDSGDTGYQTTGFGFTLNTTSIPAGTFIWLTTSAVSGTINTLEITVTYNLQ